MRKFNKQVSVHACCPEEKEGQPALKKAKQAIVPRHAIFLFSERTRMLTQAFDIYSQCFWCEYIYICIYIYFFDCFIYI